MNHEKLKSKIENAQINVKVRKRSENPSRIELENDPIEDLSTSPRLTSDFPETP
jgi:hypothetical protein